MYRNVEYGETQEHRLWRLVRSLTPTEKRLFRIQSRLHGGTEKAYVRLFDAIDRYESPEAEALRREISSAISDGSYHVLKNYLYRQILRVLRHHSTEASPETRVENLLQEVRILTEKGLQSDALIILSRAREIAERWEMNAYLTMIVSWETHLRSDRPNAASQLSSFRERCRLLDELREQYELEQRIGYLSRELDRGPAAPGSEERERFDHFVHDLDRDSPPPPGAFRRRSSYHYVWATHAYGVYDLETALEETRNLLELFRSDGRRIEERPIAYLDVLNNYLLLLHRLGRSEELLEQFDEAERLVGDLIRKKRLAGNRIHQKATASLWLREALFRIDREEYEEIVAIARRIEPTIFEVIRPETALNWSLLFHLCSIGCMMTGDDRRALDWNLRSIDNTPPSNQVMIFCGRTLEILLHLRIGNKGLISSLLRRLPLYRPEDPVLEETSDRVLELLRAMAHYSGTTRSRNRLERAIGAYRDSLAREQGLVVFGHVPWDSIASDRIPHSHSA